MFISKASSRRFQDMSWRRLQDVFSVRIFRLPRGPQDVFKRSSRRLANTSWRHLSRRLEDVFKTSSKTKNCYAEDVLKTSSRRFEDQEMFAGLLSILHFGNYMYQDSKYNLFHMHDVFYTHIDIYRYIVILVARLSKLETNG